MNARIIAVSGGDKVAPENYLCLAKSLGAMETLSKPFEIQTLLDTIEEVMGREEETASS